MLPKQRPCKNGFLGPRIGVPNLEPAVSSAKSAVLFLLTPPVTDPRIWPLLDFNALHARVSTSVSCLQVSSGVGGSITFYCLCPWSTVLVVSCGVVVRGAITSFCLCPWSIVCSLSLVGWWGQQRLIVSCTLAYVTSYHLAPSVTSYIFKWLFPIPWFVACWFPSIPVVVSLSKDKKSLFAAGAVLSSDELGAYVCSLSTLYIWGGFGWGGWVGLITSLLLRTYSIFIQLPATLRYHLVNSASQELL